MLFIRTKLLYFIVLGYNTLEKKATFLTYKSQVKKR